MPDLAPYHQSIVFVHMLGVFGFLLAHGVSAGVLFRLRTERDPIAVRTLVDLSAQSFRARDVSGLVFFFSGILAGFSGGHWASGKLWIWASLVVLFVVGGVMTPLGKSYIDRVRSAVGIDPKAKRGQSVLGDVDHAALDEATLSGRPVVLGVLGLGGIVALAWLMMFKPF
jgi:hypothetical protein